MNKNLTATIFLLFASNTWAQMKALHTAASGMSAQETNVSTISNNIANVNTVGYKRARTEFDDLGYETIQEPGARSSGLTNYSSIGYKLVVIETKLLSFLFLLLSQINQI